MSGICGIVRLDQAPVEPADLEAMAAAAAHRGPDGVHVHIEGAVGFAHLALQITRESAAERQPLLKRDLVAVIDCRVDNRSELATVLAGELATRAPTDADLVLAAYERWGEGCAAHILGDFAFAVWDARRRRLMLARDAMGMRTIYYRAESRRVLFATEVKQLLAAPGVPRRIFEPAVAAHLAPGDGSPEWSFHEGISQLPAAHQLVVDAGRPRLRRYWRPSPARRWQPQSDEERAEEFRDIYVSAVRCRLRGAKPIGVFLSGGLDSGATAATAGLLRAAEPDSVPSIRAYCFAFDELREADERHISDEIVSRYGLPSIAVPADDAWPFKRYPDEGPDLDDPVIGAFRPLHDRVLSLAKADGASAVMTGHHGDYMAGGNLYGYLDQLLTGRWGPLWRDLREHSAAWQQPLPRLVASRVAAPLLRSAWPAARLPGARAALRRLAGRPAPWAEWISADFARRVGLAGLIVPKPARGVRGDVARSRYRLVHSAWERRSVASIERSFSHHGLGFIDPWADRRILEFVLAAPPWSISRGGREKLITRQAMRGIIPEGALRSARKISPYSLYARGLKDRARDTVRDLLTDMRAAEAGWVDERRLRAHYEQVLRGASEHDGLYAALTLEWWLRTRW